jgi:hypothetical protein
MEELFNFLPAIIILFAFLGNIFKKLKKFLAEFEDQFDEGYQPEGDFGDEVVANLETQQTQSSSSEQTAKRDEEPDKEMKSRESRSRSRAASRSRSKKKKKQDKIKATEGQVISTSDFNSKQITKSIIFKEIIDKPRAKRPHEFFRRQ